MRWLTSPGPCPICGAGHTACKSTGDGRIVINQFPRAVARETEPPPLAEEPAGGGLSTSSRRTTHTHDQSTDRHAPGFSARSPQGPRGEHAPGALGASTTAKTTTAKSKAVT
jgi:hypothetical protein